VAARRFSGFTLIEVVVALAILSIGVGTVMQIFSGGLKNIHRIDLAHRAMSHGENVMNEILSSNEIVGSASLSGNLDDDFSYTAEVTEWQLPETGLTLDVAVPNIRLLHVEVQIHFKNDRFGKLYRLTCLKAISEAGEQPGGIPGSVNPMRQLFGRGSQ